MILMIDRTSEQTEVYVKDEWHHKDWTYCIKYGTNRRIK